MSDNRSYVQILRSSSIMGGAAGITLLLGIIRVKFVAVLIGTTGVGLLTSFTVLQNFVGAVAGLGIQSSAVREVAAAKASADEYAIGRTILSLRRLSLITGLLGMLAMMTLSPYLSKLAFGNHDHSLDITILSLAVFLVTLSGGQMALVQGMRRIGDLARINVFVAAIATGSAISYYAWLGLRGIVPTLITIAALQLVFAWHYARRIYVQSVKVPWTQSIRDARTMLHLGIVFMWSGLLVSALHLITVALITNQEGVDSVGIYSAAYALSGMSVGFILSAMSTDYYPHLSGLASDHSAMNRLVNEQTEIGLLLATPILLATLTLAPWIIRLFYTGEFLPSAELLQWFLLGSLGQIVSHPLGFVLVALGRGKTFMVTETSFKVIHVVLITFGLALVGIVGVAIAFLLMYVLYAVTIYSLVHRRTAFCWTARSKALILGSSILLICAFVASSLLPLWQSTVLGILAVGAASILSVRGLVQRIGESHRLVRRIVTIPGVRWVCSL